VWHMSPPAMSQPGESGSTRAKATSNSKITNRNHKAPRNSALRSPPGWHLFTVWETKRAAECHLTAPAGKDHNGWWSFATLHICKGPCEHYTNPGIANMDSRNKERQLLSRATMRLCPDRRQALSAGL
jgi:hypothetical protein